VQYVFNTEVETQSAALTALAQGLGDLKTALDHAFSLTPRQAVIRAQGLSNTASSGEIRSQRLNASVQPGVHVVPTLQHTCSQGVIGVT
jgi:hypothetical protein